MKTYTGTVVRASHDRVTPSVTFNVQPLHGVAREVTLHCGARIACTAAGMVGRRVTFQAELSERTACLTDVQLCVRSEFGLVAVKEDVRSTGVRGLEPGDVRFIDRRWTSGGW